MNNSGSNKKSVQLLVQKCHKYGVRHIVISPGSRNAPLTISFANNTNFKCYAIPDERSAAFYALGMARELNKAVAIICTSGTAVLNYAPALTEAYYQEIPVIAITADRPQNKINQEDGQTIQQRNIFAPHINYSCSLPLNESKTSLKQIETKLEKAFISALKKPQGPVHINIPFEEPLYEQCKINFDEKTISTVELNKNSTSKNSNISDIAKIINENNKVLILSGFNLPNSNIKSSINKFADNKNIPILAEATSNLCGKNIFNNVELLFCSIKKLDNKNFKPNVLITIGSSVLSKSAKIFFRVNKPKYHIDIDETPKEINTYGALSHKITLSPQEAIEIINKLTNKKELNYLNTWKIQNKKVTDLTKNFIKTSEWSDLQVFSLFFKNISEDVKLHLANSTPVRYSEFFPKHKNINYYANRGTSGIDGCTSTAAGAALVSNKKNILITGDISFFYDSNALWNNYIPNNLKIIVINNNGGNIFKIINGPNSTNQLEEFFVTNQTASVKKLCETFGIEHIKSKNKTNFVTKLKQLLLSKKCTILEVITDANTSANNYKKLISTLKKEC